MRVPWPQISSVSWLLLENTGGLVGGFWWVSVGFDGFWLVSVGFGWFWSVLISFGSCLVLVGFGGF